MLRRQAEVIANSLSCWVLSTQRGLSFFSSPSFFFALFLFFFQPYTIVHTLLAALKHWTGLHSSWLHRPPTPTDTEGGKTPPLTVSFNDSQYSKCKQEKRDNYYKTLNQHFLLTLFGCTNSKSSLSLVPHRLDGEALPQLL